jgi:hypothetical protein
MDRHADVAGADLHVTGGRVEARSPVDDAVAAGVDRDEAHAARKRPLLQVPELLTAVALEAGALEQAGGAEPAERGDRPHARADERVDVERIARGRAERDDPRDQVGPPRGEHLGEAAAAALADDGRPLALPLHERLQAPLEPLHAGARAAHVEAHPRPGRVVAGLAQPAGHHRERIVARHEARHE